MKRFSDGTSKNHSDDESITSNGSDNKKVAFATNLNTQNNKASYISNYQKLPSQLSLHNKSSTAKQYDGRQSNSPTVKLHGGNRNYNTPFHNDFGGTNHFNTPFHNDLGGNYNPSSTHYNTNNHNLTNSSFISSNSQLQPPLNKKDFFQNLNSWEQYMLALSTRLTHNDIPPNITSGIYRRNRVIQVTDPTGQLVAKEVFDRFHNDYIIRQPDHNQVFTVMVPAKPTSQEEVDQFNAAALQVHETQQNQLQAQHNVLEANRLHEHKISRHIQLVLECILPTPALLTQGFIPHQFVATNYVPKVAAPHLQTVTTINAQGQLQTTTTPVLVAEHYHYDSVPSTHPALIAYQEELKAHNTPIIKLRTKHIANMSKTFTIILDTLSVASFNDIRTEYNRSPVQNKSFEEFLASKDDPYALLSYIDKCNHPFFMASQSITQDIQTSINQLMQTQRIRRHKPASYRAYFERIQQHWRHITQGMHILEDRTLVAPAQYITLFMDPSCVVDNELRALVEYRADVSRGTKRYANTVEEQISFMLHLITEEIDAKQMAQERAQIANRHQHRASPQQYHRRSSSPYNNELKFQTRSRSPSPFPQNRSQDIANPTFLTVDHSFLTSNSNAYAPSTQSPMPLHHHLQQPLFTITATPDELNNILRQRGVASPYNRPPTPTSTSNSSTNRPHNAPRLIKGQPPKANTNHSLLTNTSEPSYHIDPNTQQVYFHTSNEPYQSDDSEF